MRERHHHHHHYHDREGYAYHAGDPGPGPNLHRLRRNIQRGKVAGVFASTGSQHGGHEATLLSTQIPLQHFGMLIAGMPYTFAGQKTGEEIVGGAPYGAGTIAGADGSRAPSETDLAGARFQGAHVARIAARLAGANQQEEAA